MEILVFFLKIWAHASFFLKLFWLWRIHSIILIIFSIRCHFSIFYCKYYKLEVIQELKCMHICSVESPIYCVAKNIALSVMILLSCTWSKMTASFSAVLDNPRFLQLGWETSRRNNTRDNKTAIGIFQRQPE